MRVVFFAGFSKSILSFNSELVEEISKRGHEIVCIGPEDDCRKQFERLGAKFIKVDFNRHNINPFKGIALVQNLKKVFKENSFDVYYGFTAVPATYGVFAASMAGIKNIYVGITGAGKIIQNRPGIFNKFIRVVLSFMYGCSLRKCRKVFFLNDDNIEYFIKHKIVREGQPVKTGGSGVNMTKFPTKPLPRKYSFLFVGALLKFKGIIEYMEAARLVKEDYPQAEFHIVGAIDERVSAITKEELDEFINDGSVIYHGFQSNVVPFYEQCSCIVLPSYSEGVPSSVLEAMSTGRPVITTMAPGCRETVIEGENGFLIPVKNVEALKDKIIYMIEHPEIAEEMAQKSVEIVKEKFDVSIVNETMLKTMKL